MHRRRTAWAVCGAVWTLAWCGPGALGGPPSMSVEVDAREVGRKLVHSTITISGVEAGALTLWHPKYVPGNHSPSGPVQNIARLVVVGCDGERLHWDRSPRDQHRIAIDVPAGCDEIRVEQTYITNQPSHISRSSDCYALDGFAGLNWNCLLWYPDGWTLQELVVTPTIRTEDDWRVITSLDPAEAQVALAGFHAFEPAPLGEVVDSPVLMGAPERLVTTDLGAASGAPHRLHTAAAEADHAAVPDWLAADLTEMLRQGEAIFGPFPRAEYHLQVLLDDETRFGLEHAESTYIGLRPRTIADASETSLKGGGGSMTVIPHEYVHVWCGKLAAPRGLVRDDYHTPIDTELLWVYEGLTTYYTDVLAVRSGLLTEAEFEHRLANRLVTAQQRAGRLWRSVEDTARAVAHVRRPSQYWADLRRTAEYYSEGALFWMEADALIRRGTGGARSLDDFSRRFFGVPTRPVGSQYTYTRADVVDALEAVYGGEDWDALITSRIERPRDSTDMGYLARRIGRELTWADEPTRLQEDDDDGATINLRASLGVSASEDAGEVRQIVPGSPADLAGVRPRTSIYAVAFDGEIFKFSRARLEDAVRASAETGGVTLYVVGAGDRIMAHELEYAGGMRWPRLVRLDAEPRILEGIMTPR